MSWRPNQQINNIDLPAPIKNAPAAPPNVVNEPKKTHAGKLRDDEFATTVRNRAENRRRDTDTVKDFSITLLDVDTTIIEHLDNTISPTVLAAGEQKKVPVMFGSPERWKAVQKDGLHRDARGKIQLPFIMLKRNTMQRNDGLITFNRYLSMPFIRAYSEKNQYDRFSVVNNIQKPVNEMYNVQMPDHVIVNYEVMIWTDLVEQNNTIIEQINFATEDYWGDSKRFKFRTSVADYSTQTEVGDTESRSVKTTFTLIVYAYLLPEVREDWKKTTQKAFTPRKVVFGVELENDDIPQKWPSNVKEYNHYKGLVLDTVCGQAACGIEQADEINLIIRNPIQGGFQGYNRFYGNKAPWNLSMYELKEILKVEPIDLIHTQSDAKVNHIINYSDSSSIDIIKEYSFFNSNGFSGLVNAIVDVDDLNSGSSNIHQQIIQFHPTWSTEDRLMIYDGQTGIEYDLVSASLDTGSNILTAFDANLVKNENGFPINIFEYEGSYEPSRDAGIQFGAMVVRASEVFSGSIHHALSMRLTYPSASYMSASLTPDAFVDPATKAFDEGEITASLGFARDLTPPPTVVYGNRFFLDISDEQENTWLDNLSGSINKEAAKTVVTALRDYGWFITDTNNFERNSGSHQFDFESDQSVDRDYWDKIGFSGSVFQNMLDPLFTTSSVKAVIDVNYSEL
jgi:hypothetical protein